MWYTYIDSCMHHAMQWKLATNFRGVKYSLFSWASWPPRKRSHGLPERMQCSAAIEIVLLTKITVFELNTLFTTRKSPAIRFYSNPNDNIMQWIYTHLNAHSRTVNSLKEWLSNKNVYCTYILPRSAFFCVMLFCRSLIGAMSEEELSFSRLQCAVSNSTHQVR